MIRALLCFVGLHGPNLHGDRASGPANHGIGMGARACLHCGTAWEVHHHETATHRTGVWVEATDAWAPETRAAMLAAAPTPAAEREVGNG